MLGFARFWARLHLRFPAVLVVVVVGMVVMVVLVVLGWAAIAGQQDTRA